MLLIRKKVRQTIEISTLLSTGGIFSKIQSITGQPFTWLTSEVALTLDNEYYLGHSGEKYINRYLQNLIRLQETEKIDDYLKVLANFIILKYKDKWNKIYNAFINSNYLPLENYAMEETRTPNLTDLETVDMTRTNETKQKTKITTSADSKTDNETHGFNSSTPVPTDSSTGDNDTTVEGALDDNVTEHENDEDGTRETKHTGTETLTRHGNIGVTTSQQMLQSEIDLRNNFDFYESIMKDVDKVITLSIY